MSARPQVVCIYSGSHPRSADQKVTHASCCLRCIAIRPTTRLSTAHRQPCVRPCLARGALHVCSPSLSSSRSPFEASAAWTQSLRPELHTLAVGGPSCLPSHRQSRHERQQLQAHGEVDQPSELAPWIFRPALTASGQGIRAHRDVQRMKNAPRQGADLGSQVATA